MSVLILIKLVPVIFALALERYISRGLLVGSTKDYKQRTRIDYCDLSMTGQMIIDIITGKSPKGEFSKW
jgi:hypothetical protein